MSKVRPPYPAEFRQQMVELVRSGRSPTELSSEFNVTAQSITNWVGQARKVQERQQRCARVAARRWRPA